MVLNHLYKNENFEQGPYKYLSQISRDLSYLAY
jgi:hypothetical protein